MHETFSKETRAFASVRFITFSLFKLLVEYRVSLSGETFSQAVWKDKYLRLLENGNFVYLFQSLEIEASSPNVSRSVLLASWYDIFFSEKRTCKVAKFV